MGLWDYIKQSSEWTQHTKDSWAYSNDIQISGLGEEWAMLIHDDTTYVLNVASIYVLSDADETLEEYLAGVKL